MKDWLKQEALAIGYEATSPETRQVLYQWADYVIVIDPRYWDQVKQEYTWNNNLTLWPIEGDPYFRCYSPELLNRFGQYIYQSGLAPLLTFAETSQGTQANGSDPDGKFSFLENKS